jgi:hypothetical protein
MNKGKNIPLIVGLSIPVLMILFIAGSIYLPGVLSKAKPQFNFLYSTGGNWGQEYFFIQQGKLQKRELKQTSPNSPNLPNSEMRLMTHDVTKNESRETSFEEAQLLFLNTAIKSRDGFEIVYGSYSDGLFPLLFFNGSDYNNVYLKGHGKTQRLNTYKQNRYINNFHFLGWIER